MAIHRLAQVHPSVEIGENVEIGPYCIVEEDVRIGDNTVLHPHVVIFSHTTIGCECEIFPGTVLGGPPQDLKARDDRSRVVIGNRNVIREYVTIHRATGDGEATIIGDDNLLMAYVHIGHNCRVGNHVAISSYSGVSGHVVIEDRVVMGGMVGVHQFVRVGTLAMLGGYSKVTQDVPPFMLVEGRPAKVYGLNIVGLRRNGFSPQLRDQLKRAYRLIYRSKLNVSEALDEIERTFPMSEELRYLVEFLRNIRYGRAGRQLDRR
ncbi:MAG TPA: acyl-ACP--UDP-N-acetylglucosamine O-acyltransferase [Armatimonadetes bacterium]|nr:acyl-ACP--UDP-N-acetylglucosamine O-acyltransferase [Armatimonadota bacterium]